MALEDSDLPKSNDGIGISLPHIELGEGREAIKFEVVLKKVPTQVEYGATVGSVVIDNESLRLEKMMEEARALREIPEKERPRRILDILRSSIDFDVDDSGRGAVSLSEVVDSGHGVCRHLSAAMLVLAKEAQMSGAYLTSVTVGSGEITEDKYLMRNIVRKDNGKPLFKHVHIGERVGPHAWVELRTSEGEWIPVDPSTKLVGDNDDELEIFGEAGYRASVGHSLQIGNFPLGVHHTGNEDLSFLPGEPTHTGVLEVDLLRYQKRISISFDEATRTLGGKSTLTEYEGYRGPLVFKITSEAVGTGLVVDIEGVSPI